MTDRKRLYNLSRVRNAGQMAEMARFEAASICMFCPEGLGPAEVPIVTQGQHWLIARNKHPYEGTALHYIGIYRAHVHSFSEVAGEAWPELFRLFVELVGPTCSIAIRSGETDCTCSTIAHFHVHVFTGVSGHPDTHEEITMHLGYKAK